MLTGTVTNAARRLGVTQPAVSKQIANLEAYFGAKLFLRSNTQLKPTQIAYKILDEFEKVHTTFDRFIDTVSVAAKRQKDVIKIGALPLYADTIAPKVISTFYERFPNVFCIVEVFPNDALIKAVQTGEVDLGFTSTPSRISSFAEHVLLAEPAVVVMPKGHSLAKNTTISISQIDEEPMISLPPSSPFQQALDAFFSAYDFAPNCIMHARTQTMIISLVRHGVGLSVLSNSIAKLFKHHVHYANIKEGFEWRCGIITKNDTARSHLTSEFLAIARLTIKSVGIN